MAIDKVIDSARLDGALKASADEIRAKTGDDGKILFDPDTGFKAAIAGIQAGGGNGPFELVYETQITLDETISTGGTNITVATIDTGIPSSVQEYLAVIECTNDTETGEIVNRFICRFQQFFYGDRYPNIGNDGCVYSELYLQYGYPTGVYIKSGTANQLVLTINAACVGDGKSFGIPCKGDYSFRLYKMNREWFGFEWEAPTSG